MRKYGSVMNVKKNIKHILSSLIIALFIIGINILYFSDSGSSAGASSTVNEAVKNEGGIWNWFREVYEWLLSLL